MLRLLHCPWCDQVVLALVDEEMHDIVFRVHRVEESLPELCRLGLRAVPIGSLKAAA